MTKKQNPIPNCKIASRKNTEKDSSELVISSDRIKSSGLVYIWLYVSSYLSSDYTIKNYYTYTTLILKKEKNINRIYRRGPVL